MTNIGKQADFLHGIPHVSSSAERDARFPLPDTNQRVANATTGFEERYDGANWQREALTLGAGPVISVLAKGAPADGVNDDAAATQAAINAAPDGATILFPAGRTYLFSAATPTISARSDLIFYAKGANINLAGTNRQALLFDGGTNQRIRWYGGLIKGSGVLSDNHQALGTLVGASAGTQNHDIVISDLTFQDVVRGVYFDVTALGDASDITLRRIFGSNIVGTGSGTGYGIVLSGVWRAVVDDCQINTAQRHAFYISVCERIALSNLRSENHAGTGIGTGECVNILRSRLVQGTNILVKSSAGPAVNVGPDEVTTSRDTGNIQLRNITCVDTASGVQDVMIGGSSPSTCSVLYNVLIDGVVTSRLSTATGGTEAVRVRHGINITVRNVKYFSAAAFTIDVPAVYIAADGGSAFSDAITVEGVRAYAPNVVGGHLFHGVDVNSAICTGTSRVTIRNNEVKAADALAVGYFAGVTNPNIEARFNRTSRGALSGTATLVAGTVTVTAPEVLTGDRIILSRQASGGTLGHLSVGTITNRGAFVINSSSATDTSVIAWEIAH